MDADLCNRFAMDMAQEIAVKLGGTFSFQKLIDEKTIGECASTSYFNEKRGSSVNFVAVDRWKRH